MTDQALMTLLQQTMMEAPDGGTTWPSGLWSRAEVLAYMNERQNRLLKSCLFQLGLSAPIPLVPGQTRVALPQDWIATQDVVWRGQNGYIRALTRGDAFEADHGLGDWSGTRGTPLLYMDYDASVLELQIAPTPTVAGTLEILYVPQGAPLTGDGEVITLPTAYQAPVFKYSVLAEMFGKNGRGKNPEKAAYCQLREALGVQVAQILLNGWV